MSVVNARTGANQCPGNLKIYSNQNNSKVQGTCKNVRPSHYVVVSNKTICRNITTKEYAKHIDPIPYCPSHYATAIIKIITAATGCPNNKAIIASIVPKNALSESMLFLIGEVLLTLPLRTLRGYPLNPINSSNKISKSSSLIKSSSATTCSSPWKSSITGSPPAHSFNRLRTSSRTVVLQ